MFFRSAAAALVPAFVSALALGLIGASPASAQTPYFQGLGDLPGGAASSAANGLAADGSVVVGESESAAGIEAFRWTLGGGIVGLGFVSGGTAPSRAHAVSADGTVIAGSGTDSNGVTRAFRHTGNTFTLLGGQSCSDCDPATEGLGVSGDGLVVLGYSIARSSSTAPIRVDPVRWAGGGTSLGNLGNLSGDEEVGEARSASFDGSVIGGSHFRNHGQDAWVWQGSGLTPLTALTTLSPRTAAATAVSADGTVLAGYGSKNTLTLPGGTTVAIDRQAVRWSGAGFATVTELGALPGAPVTNSQALATNGDGSLVVGIAADSDADDAAFIWDVANGMQELKPLLTDQYGLDLAGWILTGATGISDLTLGGFWVTGTGINPAGDEEGWVAFLIDPACSDGLDNDTDGPIDHPADAGCNSPTDWSETFDCADGIDNDGDGLVDFAADGGCLSAADRSEQPDCADGLDNDLDGLSDLDDPGCKDASSSREDPACSDGIDNDGDLDVDHTGDLECLGPWDVSELAACSDGLDNDGDGLVDHPADPDCVAADALTEAPACSDGLDNDGDGRIDFPDQYPGCADPDDSTEAPQCSDGIDNDGDGMIDHPADADCTSASTESENPVDLTASGLFAVDPASRALFRVDLGSGIQTLVSQGARLESPQGLDRRGVGLLVADPAGLVAIAGTGSQNVLTPPLSSNESLQVDVDAGGDALILEADGIYTHSPGDPTTTLWLSVPSPEPLPTLGVLDGDTLAIEDDGSVLTTGLGFTGGGVIRVDATTKVAAVIDAFVFARARWKDLAIEDDGQIIAVGREFDHGIGVYRVDPVSGLATALNNTHAWMDPTGVTVDRTTGSIWVADAGTCADGVCNGGLISEVDPITGAVTPLSSGGLISGDLDVVYVPEPSLPALFSFGLLALVLAGARHARRSA